MQTPDATATNASVNFIELAGDIVSAYVSRNNVPVSDLPGLISSVHTSLSNLGGPAVDEQPTQEKATAQAIRKSITPDYLISFEDGKQYKTLRRHLTLRGLSPEQYRTKWGLAADYPMTSSNYSEQRSQLARSLGLGQQRRKTPAAAAAEPAEPAKTPAKRGSKKKDAVAA